MVLNNTILEVISRKKISRVILNNTIVRVILNNTILRVILNKMILRVSVTNTVLRLIIGRIKAKLQEKSSKEAPDSHFEGKGKFKELEKRKAKVVKATGESEEAIMVLPSPKTPETRRSKSWVFKTPETRRSKPWEFSN